ncbi:pyridoxamine 5'-phosphate oxidase family protein [Microbacterium betulae]|uniref:Pyridoxamine 5'-phosphate oxidase family protein n=1 Tax=Microbacterium betulae TaxID=2981139 RepID=A0AA97FFN6_9MICO|nr:pyridoxamine 5'-phosphate oxidase family protein [Microbacterium sp. AB]WOF22671.1 pyridoxamine 5'-phosphate oxidase family protein [Microbacterium sp. AB]
MGEVDDQVVDLSDRECFRRLGGQELGRIVTRVRDTVDVFPVNYVLDGDEIVFRTAEGSKLVELTVDDEVLFEVDDHTGVDAWSVVVRGRARALSSSAEIEAADALPLRPWIPTMKRTYVRIEPTTVSGRSFLRGPEPDRHGVQQY